MIIELNDSERRKLVEYFSLPEGDETPLAIWVIGRPAAGKTTTATLLCESLRRLNRDVALVDGEAVRHIFDGGLGYSKADRLIALRRLIHVNRFLQARGVIPITATICGLSDFRELARESIANVQFIFLDCPLSVAAKRDPKGLYARARRGEIKDFFGIDLDFEAPEDYALRINSDLWTPSEVVGRILRYLEDEDLLSTQDEAARSQVRGR